MYLCYYRKSECGDTKIDFFLDSYPNLLSCMVVSCNEILVQFQDALDCVCTRRLKIDSDHYFTLAE